MPQNRMTPRTDKIERMFAKLLDDPDLPETDKIQLRLGREECLQHIAQGTDQMKVLQDVLKATSQEICRRAEKN